mmetsp:Transcript_1949/g.4155  ORF Transcript_1949/g.4155 Transcript_1949/m.4155 type:complete len:81 (+) Transcript_1949:927-1169(+)
MCASRLRRASHVGPRHDARGAGTAAPHTEQKLVHGFVHGHECCVACDQPRTARGWPAMRVAAESLTMTMRAKRKDWHYYK